MYHTSNAHRILIIVWPVFCNTRKINIGNIFKMGNEFSATTDHKSGVFTLNSSVLLKILQCKRLNGPLHMYLLCFWTYSTQIKHKMFLINTYTHTHTITYIGEKSYKLTSWVIFIYLKTAHNKLCWCAAKAIHVLVCTHMLFWFCF